LYKREQKDNILNGHLTHCPPLDEKWVNMEQRWKTEGLR
jgi:hypothetical protein